MRAYRGFGDPVPARSRISVVRGPNRALPQPPLSAMPGAADPGRFYDRVHTRRSRTRERGTRFLAARRSTTAATWLAASGTSLKLSEGRATQAERRASLAQAAPCKCQLMNKRTSQFSKRGRDSDGKNSQADRQRRTEEDRQTDRLAGEQAGRQTGRQAVTDRPP